MRHEQRIDKTRAELPGIGVDALLVTNLTNVRYLTGFSGTNGQVLVWDDGALFFTDPRYAARAADLVEGAEVAVYRDKLTDLLPERLGSIAATRVGIEAETVTVAQRDRFTAALEGIELISTSGLLEGLRRSKDDDEIAAVRRAVEYGDAAFNWILDRIKPGRTEAEIALDLEVHMRNEGADDVSFEPIVGSGPLSAHIHHTPSDRQVQTGDFVLLDFGSLKDGYHSDLTRTVVVGTATDEQRQMYDLVLRAQAAGIDAVRAGAEGTVVDSAARELITGAGYANEFGHGLGHGVGLDIHEAPRLARTSQDELVEGDVVTVEPGIYRVGWGGIRIEDCVLVTKEGAETLGNAPKSALLEV
ncbi:MAG TPA: Xaa-Pro peptidase family protein [Actinomycetota bacterium]|nr:Xaa-Pro peptidase family protein [Actinomycetota bacterium]